MSIPTAVWVAIGVAFVALVVMAEVFTDRGQRRGVIACGVALLAIAALAFALYLVTMPLEERPAMDWDAFHERVTELED